MLKPLARRRARGFLLSSISRKVGMASALGVLRKLSINPTEVSLGRRLAITSGVLTVLLLLVVLVSAAHGPARISYGDTAAILLDDVGVHVGGEYSRRSELVVEQIRLPRIFTAGLVGLALATAGAAFQGLFRNPMADPGIIGVSTGGALGGVIAIITGLAAVHVLFAPAAAFLGALATALVVYGAASVGGRFTMGTLILAGVAVSSLLAACITFILINTQSIDAARQLLFWLSGGFDGRLWLHVRIIAGPVLIGAVIVYASARALNLMLLGDEGAQSLGVQVKRTRQILLVMASLVTGVAVSVSGVIGFVGLVVPHMMRLIVGPDHRVLLPVSALAGAVFLIGADTIARLVIAPAELSVGVITAFVGAPFFLFLLIKNRRRANLI